MKRQKTLSLTIALFLLPVLAACGQNPGPVQGGYENNASTQEEYTENSTAENTEAQRDPVLPQEAPSQPQSPTTEVDAASYWVEIQDSTVGFRFAVPCFWRMETNDLSSSAAESSAGYAYSFFNYPADYPDLFEDGIIPVENNPFEVVLEVIELPAEDVSNQTSLLDFVNAEYSGELAAGTIADLMIEEISLDGTEAVLVFVNEDPHSYKYYLLRVNPEYLLEIKAHPSSKLFDTLDLQAMLDSITIDPQASVPLPSHVPGESPTSPAGGTNASCIHGPLWDDPTPYP